MAKKMRIQVEDQKLLVDKKEGDGVLSVELPKFNFKTHQIPAGMGMIGDLDVVTSKMDAITATITTNGGTAAGLLRKPGFKEVELREAVSEYDVAGMAIGYNSVKHRMVGQTQNIDMGTSKVGEGNEDTTTMNLTYYEREVNGVVDILVDIPNGRFSMDGVDYTSYKELLA